jgi:signal transduction histidine kinase
MIRPAPLEAVPAMTTDTSHHADARRHGRSRVGSPADAARSATPDEVALTDCAPETAIQLLVESTRTSEAVLRGVAQTLSHELRTPLTPIYSGSKLLSRGTAHLSRATMREVSTAMAADAERLLRIVEDLVVAASLPGEPAISGEPVLLQRVVPMVARAAESRWPGTTVEVDLVPQLPAVRADAVHLEQVLRNVLDNAAQFGPPQGRVAIRAATVLDRVEVHVLDRGPGVEDDQRERVFELFRRSGTADRTGGLGLGLFVSRRLVELMGGRVWVDPRSGGGADFVIELRTYPSDER